MFFTVLLSIIILQRLIELIYAKRNEKWMRSKGAYEVGNEHYKYIVALHVLFFLSLIGEHIYRGNNLSSIWPILLVLLLLTQVLRIWVMKTMGKFWNTKIIILEGAKVKVNGPFRFIRHPNYFVVSLEFLLLPMLFQSYFTLVVFSIANAFLLLKIRIPAEERALQSGTNYSKAFLKPEVER